MIASKDRSFYIGASDVSFVVGNWGTKTFEKWWRTKQGIDQMDFTNAAMMAGTAYEHKILDFLNLPGLVKDRQITKGRLRVNLDGNTKNAIYEVKTYNADKRFKVSKAYREQVNIQMYASGLRDAYIVAYGLTEKDYCNFYRDIEDNRLSRHRVEYDEDFVTQVFVPRFHYLSDCLDSGKFPRQVI